MSKKLKRLWRCPKCSERFVTANMWHSCGKFSLEALFSRSEPLVYELFKKFQRMAQACGPLRTIPQKTRVVFQARVRFAGCYPRKAYLICSVALPRRLESPRFVRIEEYTAHFVGHYFHISSETELDAEVQDWLRESYEVGLQQHLRR